jgi:hypothetical protein
MEVMQIGQKLIRNASDSRGGMMTEWAMLLQHLDRTMEVRKRVSQKPIVYGHEARKGTLRMGRLKTLK